MHQDQVKEESFRDGKDRGRFSRAQGSGRKKRVQRWVFTKQMGTLSRCSLSIRTRARFSSIPTGSLSFTGLRLHSDRFRYTRRMNFLQSELVEDIRDGR